MACFWASAKAVPAAASAPIPSGRGFPLHAENCSNRPQGLLKSTRPLHVSWPSGRLDISLHRSLICRSNYGNEGGMLGSEIVQREAERITKDFKQLSSLQSKYFSFDTEGKSLYIEHMDQFVERMQIFTTRFRLSDDPEVKAILHKLDAELLESGMTFDNLIRQLKELLIFMRSDVEHERATGRSAFASSSQGPGLDQAAFGGRGMPDIAKYLEDPEVMEAFMEPGVLAAFQDMMANPANAVKYQGNEKIRKLILKMFGKPL
eukprot:jgi/Mesvir1/13516/Mv06311-RA.1